MTNREYILNNNRDNEKLKKSLGFLVKQIRSIGLCLSHRIEIKEGEKPKIFFDSNSCYPTTLYFENSSIKLELEIGEGEYEIIGTILREINDWLDTKSVMSEEGVLSQEEKEAILKAYESYNILKLTEYYPNVLEFYKLIAIGLENGNGFIRELFFKDSNGNLFKHYFANQGKITFICEKGELLPTHKDFANQGKITFMCEKEELLPTGKTISTKKLIIEKGKISILEILETLFKLQSEI